MEARIATRCVHAGRATDADVLDVVTPLSRSATFRLTDEAYRLRAEGRADEARIYGRETNPTVDAVEALLSDLEGAERALLYSSGQAALTALALTLLERGDRAVFGRPLFGGTKVLVDRLLPRLGVEPVEVDVTDADALERAIDGRARLLFVESVANPTLEVADVERAAELVRANRLDAPRGADERTQLAVDATFATPIGQRPLALGADLVLHSATKYLGGHDDLIAGVLAGADTHLREAWSWRTRGGACLDPTAAWLLERGVKTLDLRVRAASAGATHLARFLVEHPRVRDVRHPSLESGATHAVARRLLDVPGGMLSFVVEGGDEAALAVVRRFRLILEASSLGGVESLASLPFNMSHSHFGAEERLAMGIPPGLVRLSVGIEDPEDLRADLEQALAG